MQHKLVTFTALSLGLALPLGCDDGASSPESPGMDASVPTTGPSGPSPTAPSGATEDAGGPLFEAPSVSVPTPTSTAPTTEPPSDYVGPTAEDPIVECASAVATGEDPLVDDFEDLDDLLNVVDGREGGWYTYDDGTDGVSQSMTFAAASSGSNALHLVGGPFDQYSGMGFVPRWTETGDEHCSYDASYYSGIRLWIMGSGGVRVALQNPVVRTVEMGGGCPNDSACYDSHGFDIELSPTGRYYDLPFSEATQAGWGVDVGPFDPSALFVVELQFPSGTVYDLWVDDVSFYRDGAGDAGAAMDGGSESSDAGLDAGTGSLDAATPEAGISYGDAASAEQDAASAERDAASVERDAAADAAL